MTFVIQYVKIVEEAGYEDVKKHGLNHNML